MDNIKNLIRYKDATIRINIEKHNFASEYGPDKTDSLVYYVPDTNTVIVDDRARNDYINYAVIHECLCCGKYQHLAPEVHDKKRRCVAIDKALLAEMPRANRLTYLRKRIEMFETLLEKKLNPKLEDSFRQSLRELKELQEKGIY